MSFKEQTFANGGWVEAAMDKRSKWRVGERAMDKRSPVARTTGLKYEKNCLLHEIWGDTTLSQSNILPIRHKYKRNVAKRGCSNK